MTQPPHSTAELSPPPATPATKAPSVWRAWFYLLRTSWQRQARAHLMVWIAGGLIVFLTLFVGLITAGGVWDVRNWRHPRRGGLTFSEWILYVRFAPRSTLAQRQPPDALKPEPRRSDLWASLYQEWNHAHFHAPGDGQRAGVPTPATLIADPVQLAVAGAYAAALESPELRQRTALVSFTRIILFNIFATFLLPLCSLSFATEAIGREREQRNLLWMLTRPLPLSAVYLGKFVALLPWCLALNLAGFGLICLAGGEPGRAALALYWPAVVMGTVAFAALFHLMGALFRRPAVVAILYSFFLETVMGNLPGHLKRGSISFYMRCLMYDEASVFHLSPDRPLLYEPVSGPIAWAVLLGVTALLLAAGSWVFARTEYLDLG